MTTLEQSIATLISRPFITDRIANPIKASIKSAIFEVKTAISQLPKRPL